MVVFVEVVETGQLPVQLFESIKPHPELLSTLAFYEMVYYWGYFTGVRLRGVVFLGAVQAAKRNRLLTDFHRLVKVDIGLLAPPDFVVDVGLLFLRLFQWQVFGIQGLG